MTKNHLIFLHGALGSKLQWEKFLKPFEDFYIIHNLNFPGHGDSIIRLEDYNYASLTDSVENYILKNAMETFSIIGYSLGGYIGLNLALRNIKGYISLITLATKLKWDNDIVNDECLKLSPEKLEAIIPKLEDEHGSNFPDLLVNTKSILKSIGKEPLRKEQFKNINTKVFLMRGTNDRMVSDEETIGFAAGSEHFKILLLDQQPHTIQKMGKELISGTCLSLLKQYETDTFN